MILLPAPDLPAPSIPDPVQEECSRRGWSKRGKAEDRRTSQPGAERCWMPQNAAVCPGREQRHTAALELVPGAHAPGTCPADTGDQAWSLTAECRCGAPGAPGRPQHPNLAPILSMQSNGKPPPLLSKLGNGPHPGVSDPWGRQAAPRVRHPPCVHRSFRKERSVRGAL